MRRPSKRTSTGKSSSSRESGAARPSSETVDRGDLMPLDATSRRPACRSRGTGYRPQRWAFRSSRAPSATSSSRLPVGVGTVGAVVAGVRPGRRRRTRTAAAARRTGRRAAAPTCSRGLDVLGHRQVVERAHEPVAARPPPRRGSGWLQVDAPARHRAGRAPVWPSESRSGASDLARQRPHGLAVEPGRHVVEVDVEAAQEVTGGVAERRRSRADSPRLGVLGRHPRRRAEPPPQLVAGRVRGWEGHHGHPPDRPGSQPDQRSRIADDVLGPAEGRRRACERRPRHPEASIRRR